MLSEQDSHAWQRTCGPVPVIGSINLDAQECVMCVLLSVKLPAVATQHSEMSESCRHPKLEQRPKFADILLQLRGIYKELRMAAG